MARVSHRHPDEVPSLTTTARASLAGIVVAHNRHDAAGFAARFAPDGIVRILPTGDTVRGREQIAAFLEASLRAFPDWQLERRGLDDCADATWVQWTITGTHAGEFMGHRATHRGLELLGCSRFTFTAEGLVAEEGVYLDPASILRQLGLLLEPPKPKGPHPMTAPQQLAHDGSSIEAYDAIAAAVQLYIDGVAQGDAAKVAEAFHPDAQMYGAVGDHRYDMPISDFCHYVGEHPADVDGTFRARITSIVQAGDAACAGVTEENHLGTLTFADFLTLCRSDGRWRIVNKTFAHTAGEMPAPEG